MTHEEKQYKRNWFLFLIGYFTFGYLVINVISSRRGAYFDVTTHLDTAMPFVPVFIFGYILVYVSILIVYFTINNMDDWRRAVVSFLSVTTIAYIFFLLCPVKMSMRPDLSGLSGISNVVTKFYYMIDMPYNCFPSLHVAYPTLATLLIWRNYKRSRILFVIMTAIVAVSVVLVKQHYLADVAAGVANAALCFWLTVKLEGWWIVLFPERCTLNAER